MTEPRLTDVVAQLLGNREVISFLPAIARAIGDVEATVLLCQACYWQSIVGTGEWFYKLRDAERDDQGGIVPPSDASRQSWEWETALSRPRQESARRTLKALGLLEEQRRGVPAKLYYRVDLDRLTEFLLENFQLAGIPPTGRQKSSRQDGVKRASKPADKPPTITKTTSEISDTTTTPVTSPSSSAVGNDGRGSSRDVGEPTGLIFERSVEPHRDLLIQLLACFPVSVAQEITDELAGALEAVSAGRRKQIENKRGWVGALIKKHHLGDFVLDYGRTIADRRAGSLAGANSNVNQTESALPSRPEVVAKHVHALHGMIRKAKLSKPLMTGS